MSEPIESEVPIETTAEYAHRDTERRRLRAYADPETGSDRHFAEANRLEAAGLPSEAEAARLVGLSRYEEIKQGLPWTPQGAITDPARP